MRRRELRGRPSFSKACKRDRPSKCASITGVCSTEITRSGKNSCSTARRVAHLLVVGHQLTSPTILRRVRDREIAVGLEDDAKAVLFLEPRKPPRNRLDAFSAEPMRKVREAGIAREPDHHLGEEPYISHQRSRVHPRLALLL